MKRFSWSALFLMAAFAGTALASGVYYTTSRVTISGTRDWGSLQPGVYENDYAISASSTALAGVGISGDPQFSMNASLCGGGVGGCSAAVTLSADEGGDYVAIVSGQSLSGVRIYGSSTSYPIKAHVAGANYTLTGSDNGNSSATYTLTSTGEAVLSGLAFGASTYNGFGVAHVTKSTCGDTLAIGASCSVVVTVSWPGDPRPYAYPTLQVSGNTRQQPPARVTLVVPRAND